MPNTTADYACRTWTQRPGEPGPRGDHERRRDNYRTALADAAAAADLFAALVDAIDALAGMPAHHGTRHALWTQAKTAADAWMVAHNTVWRRAEQTDGYYLTGERAAERRRTCGRVCPDCRALLDAVAAAHVRYTAAADARLRITHPDVVARRRAAEARRVRNAWLDDNCEPYRADEW